MTDTRQQVILLVIIIIGLCDWWGGHSLSGTGWDMLTDINEFDTYQESHVRKYVQFTVNRLFSFLLMSLEFDNT